MTTWTELRRDLQDDAKRTARSSPRHSWYTTAYRNSLCFTTHTRNLPRYVPSNRTNNEASQLPHSYNIFLQSLARITLFPMYV